MDGKFFNELRDCLASISRYELDGAEEARKIFNESLISAAKVEEDDENCKG